MRKGQTFGTHLSLVSHLKRESMKTIAFLAPEIPALSATFVYNEILALQGKGYTVVPISVHVPTVAAQEDRLVDLVNKTSYLYRMGIVSFLLANITCFFSSPPKYFRTLGIVFLDSLKVGLFSRTGLGLFYRFLAACRVAIILRQRCCNHLHTHFAHVPTDIAMYASLLTGVPFSFTSHANDLFERGWLLLEKVGRAKFAVTISEYNREYLVSMGCDRSSIHIVRCGVDINRFSSVTADTVFPPYRIGTIGRMVEKKGFDVLLEAAAQLRQKNISFTLSIVGSGPLENDLHLLSHTLDLDNIAEFPGAMANEDVPGWLQGLDLFVLPCQKDTNGDQDGIPVVLMEAMLSGVPVISTVISGIPELISHGKEGLLFKSMSPYELAEGMQYLLLDNKLRKQLVENAIWKVKNEFDSEVNVRRIMRLLAS